MKLPSFQFYPGDWLKDPNLRRCSHAAKGVWIDMLCLMFEADQRGILATGRTPWTDDEIAQAVGGPLNGTLACLTELLDKKVAGRNDIGAVYSRRLVRDEQQRQKNAIRQQRYRNANSNGDSNGPVTGMSEDEGEDEKGSDSGEGCGKGAAKLRDFTDYFVERWAVIEGGKYPWSRADGPNAADIWRRLGEDIAAAKSVVDNFLADTTDFYKGHKLGKLMSDLPRFVTKNDRFSRLASGK